MKVMVIEENLLVEGEPLNQQVSVSKTLGQRPSVGRDMWDGHFCFGK